MRVKEETPAEQRRTELILDLAALAAPPVVPRPALLIPRRVPELALGWDRPSRWHAALLAVWFGAGVGRANLDTAAAVGTGDRWPWWLWRRLQRRRQMQRRQWRWCGRWQGGRLRRRRRRLPRRWLDSAPNQVDISTHVALVSRRTCSGGGWLRRWYSWWPWRCGQYWR